MSESPKDMQVVGYAKQRSIRALQLCLSPAYIALVTQVDKEVFHSIGQALEGVIRILDRYERNKKIDNFDFLRIYINMITGWEASAREIGGSDFCNELDEICQILNAVSLFDEDQDYLDFVHDVFVKREPRNFPSRPAKTKEEIKEQISSSTAWTGAPTEREILIHNERTKTTVSAINTTAVGLLGGGVILPIISLSYPLTAAPPNSGETIITATVWTLMATGIHWCARSMLGELK